VELLVHAEVICAHCGEMFALEIDTSERRQTFVQDCEVCCRPMTLSIHCRPGELLSIMVER
jgi:hypothetical protein